MNNMTLHQSEIDDILRAYFTLFHGGNTGAFRDEWHNKVVSILRDYPEYANFFLTNEERVVE